MNQIRFRWSFFILAALFISSCSDIQQDKQLADLSELSITLDSISDVFSNNQLDSITDISITSYGVENRIKSNYVSDTINMELGVKMDRFKLMRKRLKNIGKGMRVIENGIKETEEQLSLLSEDIKNGNGERDKYDENIAFEAEKVEQLRLLTDEHVETVNFCRDTYNDLYEELNAFSMMLLAKKKQSSLE